MRSGERGGAGKKKSGYYPAENVGIDKTRVAITADRTNTMIASERNSFFFGISTISNPHIRLLFYNLPTSPPTCTAPFVASFTAAKFSIGEYKSRRNKRRTVERGWKRGRINRTVAVNGTT